MSIPGVMGLVFTGAGSAALSVGMNIETFVGMDCAGAKTLTGQLAGVVQAIRRSPVVTVAAVRGTAWARAFDSPLPATSTWSPRRRPSLPETGVVPS